MSESKARIKYIDMAKAIAMVAIIFGHTGFQKPSGVENLIFSFHMPLFFIASGFFFNQKGLSRQYLWKLIKQLIIPYLLISFGIIFINIIIDLCNGVSVWPNVLKWLSAMAYGSGTRTDWSYWFTKEIVIIGLLWFFLALFWGKIILASVLKMADEHFILQGVIICGIAWTAVYMSQNGPWLPLSIYAGLSATFFIWVGCMFKKTGILDRPLPIPFLIFLIMLAVFITLKVKPPYMVSNRYNGGLINVIGGIALSYLVLKICKNWEAAHIIGVRFLSYIGKNTLILAGIHQLEAKFIRWNTTVPNLMKSIGIPTNYWTVAIIRCIFVFSIFFLLKGLLKAIRFLFDHLRQQKKAESVSKA